MKKPALLIVLVLTFQISVLTQPCLPEGITFTTQEQIDNFQTNNPNCTEIEGNVYIGGYDIANLNGLSLLTSIGGSLVIGEDFGGNDSLTNLTGLGSVTSIGGDLMIVGNYAMTSLEGLDNVTSIGGDLKIGIWNYGNPNLLSLAGLSNVTSIGGEIWIMHNSSLTNMIGLDGLTSTAGELFICRNSSLTSLEGLQGLTSIGGALGIGNNGALTSLTGLENLTYIEGSLLLGIIDLGGPEGNPVLISLSALAGLSFVGGELFIGGNNALTSLAGLENIDANSIADLTIFYNNSLAECEVQSICEYLVSPNGEIEIHDNAIGCNNQEEVEEACEAIGIEDLSHHTEFSIYPNPATNKLFVNSKNGLKLESVCIYNQLGQVVVHENRTFEKIDISTLDQGIYIVDIELHELKVRKMLIIK